MSKVLFFRLFGPLAAWGTSERGVVLRPSQRYPTRGAVLGMICAALGIEISDVAEASALNSGLSVAVAAHGPRRIVSEYRTSQEGYVGRRFERMTRKQRLEQDHGKTQLTTRQCVEDGLWRGFLTNRDGGPHLDSIAKALNRPAFEIFLGRREYALALPLAPRVTEGGLADAVDAYPVVPTSLPGERSQLHALYDSIRNRILQDASFDLRW